MPRRLSLLAASLLLCAGTGVAASPDSEQVERSANGEFLFKHYPPRAKAAGEQGRVGFRVLLDGEGSLTSCKVTQSSGYERLDNETCELIVRYARFAPVLDPSGRGVVAVQNGFVNWRLPTSMVSTRTASAEKGIAGNPDELICRRTARTGSLVAREKRCMTRREWALTRGQIQGEYGEMQGKGSAWDGMGGD
jgi:TonB family protein